MPTRHPFKETQSLTALPKGFVKKVRGKRESHFLKKERGYRHARVARALKDVVKLRKTRVDNYALGWMSGKDWMF